MKKLLSTFLLLGFLCTATVSFAKCPCSSDFGRPMPPEKECHKMMPKKPCDIEKCKKMENMIEMKRILM